MTIHTSIPTEETVPAATGNDSVLSLVVPTLGRSDDVRKMLQSMLAQTERRFELIIVDQNADDRLDPVIAEARQAGLIITHLRRSERGAAAARNAGLALAQCALVGFPDDDCWYEADAVEKAIAHFGDRHDADGFVGHWVEYDPQGSRVAAPLRLEDWRRYKGGDVACFVLFFRTPVLRAAGGFSEDLGVGRYFGSAEEEDLVLRLLETGAKIDYVPDVHIHHRHADVPRFTPDQKRRHRFYGRGTGAVLAKHKMPVWVLARGLVGPFYHALKAPNPIEALRLSAQTVAGRAEGMVGWWRQQRR